MKLSSLQRIITDFFGGPMRVEDVTIPNENHNAFFSSTHRVIMKLSSLQRIITYSCGGQ